MINQSNLEEILGDLSVYQNPDLLKDEFGKFLDTSKIKTSDMEKYQGLLSNIKYASQKILKYEFYFQEFYPDPEKISAIEALNYHIHSYLEDSDIIKEKIVAFLNNLRKDIRDSLGDNESEKTKIKEFFDAGVQKTEEVFAGIVKHRNSHHHSGMRFIDGDLLKAENAQNEQKLFQNPPFSEMVKPDKIAELMKKLEQEKEESFEKSKARWIKMATDNNGQSSGYLNALFDAVAPSLYQFLGIKPTNEIPEIKALKDKVKQSG
jgi:hypothetical protein